MKYLKKTCALTLSAAMAISMVSAAGNVSYAAGNVEKEETVYVNQDADGTVDEITVSDWLKNVAGKEDISDVSNLTDIENVKGDEEFQQKEDGTLTWKADNADIYYQGKSNAALPVGVKISYKLDGKQMKASEMAGKSGELEMTIQYENNATYEDKIDGETTKLNTPFLMASAVILPVDQFSEVEVSQGKVVSEGSNQILVAYGVPGLADSLKLSGDIKEEMEKKISDTVTITAEVKDFSMDAIYTVASSNEFSDIDLDEENDIQDVENAVNDLVGATDELLTGSSDLSDGLTTLQSSFKTYAAGVGTANTGASDLADGAGKLKTGISKYTAGVKSLTDGTGQYITGTKSLTQGVKSYVEGEKQIDAGIGTLYAGTKDFPTQYGQFSAGLKEYINGVNQLTNEENVNALVAGSSAVSDGISQINQGLSQLNGSYDNYDTIIQYLDDLKSGLTSTQQTVVDTVIASIKDIKQKQQVAISNMLDRTGENSELAIGARDLAGAMSQISQNASGLRQGGQTLAASNEAISAGITDIAGGVSNLYAGVQQLSSNNEALLKGAAQLEESSTTITEGISQITKSSATLNSSAKELSKGAKDLSKGVGSLKTATNDVTAGINKLQSGSLDLVSGMNKFKNEGTGKLQDEFNDNIKTVLDRFQSLTGDKAVYKSYSGIADGMNGKVKFIFQTAEISDSED